MSSKRRSQHFYQTLYFYIYELTTLVIPSVHIVLFITKSDLPFGREEREGDATHLPSRGSLRRYSNPVPRKTKSRWGKTHQNKQSLRLGLSLSTKSLQVRTVDKSHLRPSYSLCYKRKIPEKYPRILFRQIWKTGDSKLNSLSSSRKIKVVWIEDPYLSRNLPKIFVHEKTRYLSLFSSCFYRTVVPSHITLFPFRTLGLDTIRPLRWYKQTN